MSLYKTLDELLKPEVNRPHRGQEFLLNLAYKCTPNFGEDYQLYLNKPLTMLAPNPDEKVMLFVTYHWLTDHVPVSRVYEDVESDTPKDAPSRGGRVDDRGNAEIELCPQRHHRRSEEELCTKSAKHCLI